MKSFKEWTREGAKTITITCRDNEGTLEKILNSIKNVGGTGHSFKVIVDPDAGHESQTFEWDGDGSDSIYEIKVKSA